MKSTHFKIQSVAQYKGNKITISVDSTGQARINAAEFASIYNKLVIGEPLNSGLTLSNISCAVGYITEANAIAILIEKCQEELEKFSIWLWYEAKEAKTTADREVGLIPVQEHIYRPEMLKIRTVVDRQVWFHAMDFMMSVQQYFSVTEIYKIPSYNKEMINGEYYLNVPGMHQILMLNTSYRIWVSNQLIPASISGSTIKTHPILKIIKEIEDIALMSKILSECGNINNAYDAIRLISKSEVA